MTLPAWSPVFDATLALMASIIRSLSIASRTCQRLDQDQGKSAGVGASNLEAMSPSVLAFSGRVLIQNKMDMSKAPVFQEPQHK